MIEPNPGQRARLQRIAFRAMTERGLLAEFAPEVLAEVDRPDPLPDALGPVRRDLRELPWSSIDNDDSRDLDQLTVAEELPDGATRVRVAVADVDAGVAVDSAVDGHARHNTTSVYTAAQIFPMLPEQLCYDLTSLGEGEDRPAQIVDMVIDASGSLSGFELYPARVQNHAKLTYDRIGAWLGGDGSPPDRLRDVEGLAANLRIQDGAAQRLRRARHGHGALDLETIQGRAVLDGDQVVDLKIERGNRAKELIEDLMIAANEATARFLESRRVASLRRVVRSPKRWERIVDVAFDLGADLPPQPNSKALAEFLLEQRRRDPVRFPDLSLTIIKLIGSGEYIVRLPGRADVGHFGLAVRNYTHSTAPNRRFPDLITQRLVKAAIAESPPPYDAETLAALAKHCTRKEDDAGKVERQVGKSAAALLLESRIGERFEAVVTGAAAKGTWVRLLTLPVEGMLVEGARGLDVGDPLEVMLVRTDAERGFIDFRRLRRGHD